MAAAEDVSLAELWRRTSAKWRAYPPDVLPLPVAGMDFPGRWTGRRGAARRHRSRRPRRRQPELRAPAGAGQGCRPPLGLAGRPGPGDPHPTGRRGRRRVGAGLDAIQAASRDRARSHLLCSPHHPTGTGATTSSGWRRWPPCHRGGHLGPLLRGARQADHVLRLRRPQPRGHPPGGRGQPAPGGPHHRGPGAGPLLLPLSQPNAPTAGRCCEVRVPGSAT
jgi:hypothetical protein